jgi:hypothetical protein
LTKNRLEYLSDPDILPQKWVGEYMKKLGQHLLDPLHSLKLVHWGGNGVSKGWNEPISGTHFLTKIREIMFFLQTTALNFTRVWN